MRSIYLFIVAGLMTMGLAISPQIHFSHNDSTVKSQQTSQIQKINLSLVAEASADASPTPSASPAPTAALAPSPVAPPSWVAAISTYLETAPYVGTVFTYLFEWLPKILMVFTLLISLLAVVRQGLVTMGQGTGWVDTIVSWLDYVIYYMNYVITLKPSAPALALQKRKEKLAAKK
jgi:hypothetical protein